MAQTDRDGGTTTPNAPPAYLTWRGVWGTGLSYTIYDTFFYGGSSYIVLETHTSGVFATDLASGLFELMAAQGTAGAGTGDMLAANNLIEVNPVLARNNLNAALEDSEGASVTAAATTDIWVTDGNTRHITGNTTITSFGTAPQAGARMKLIFDGTPLLTQSANLDLNAGGSNITIEAGDWAEVYADTTTQFDVVVHRKSGNSVVGSDDIKSFTAVANTPANGVTITIPAGSLQFRSTTLNSGTPVTRSIASPISLVISSGSTLGAVSAVASRIAVLAIDNAGTVEVAAVNVAGGVDLSETGLISTTAEGGAGGADSATVIYSTTARSNVAYRVIGFYDETQATAGTHVSALTLVQGVGGVANLNKSVTSGDLAVPAASSVTTFAHGLSGVPAKVKVNLKCTTAELGYSVGDMVPIEFTHANTPSWIPFNVYSDPTNVGVSQTAGAGAINIQHKTTFTFTAITLASWKLVINASIN